MRIRSIKPSVFKDADLWDLAQSTGFPILQAFEGLWCAADREGRFKWKPRELKTDILPYWDGDFSRVLDALMTRGFVVKYTCGGREYGVVRTFSAHQIVNNREAESVLPEPPENKTESVTSTREVRVDHASTTPLVPAPAEGKGREGNMEGSGIACARADHVSFQPEADDTPETDRRRGSDFMLQATVRSWQGHDRDLQLIGAKPESERRVALDAIRRDPWCLANMPKVSPAHVVRKWNDYSTGAKPMQQVAANDPKSIRNVAALGTVLKQLEAANQKARNAEPDSWERVEADRELATLEQRADKLKATGGVTK